MGSPIIFKHYSFSDVPNNIGFISLLDSARTKYLNKIYFNSDFQECKIVAIEFAEDTDKYSQLFGPYNVFYAVGKDTTRKGEENSSTTESKTPLARRAKLNIARWRFVG